MVKCNKHRRISRRQLRTSISNAAFVA